MPGHLPEGREGDFGAAAGHGDVHGRAGPGTAHTERRDRGPIAQHGVPRLAREQPDLAAHPESASRLTLATRITAKLAALDAQWHPALERFGGLDGPDVPEV